MNRLLESLMIVASLLVLGSCSQSDAPGSSGEISVTPVTLAQRLTIDQVIPDAAFRRMYQRVAVESPQHISTVLHAIRFYGPDRRVYLGTPQECSLLDLLTNESLSRSHLNGFGLVRTPYGVRGLTVARPRAFVESSRQSHDLQILATLAALGVPLTHEIRFAEHVSSVQHLLDDAIATFSFERKEIEWSALSMILYLPPTKCWKNKFGREFDFNQLCDHLLKRPLNVTCSGTHLLYSMTALFLVDRQQRILSDRNAARLKERLETIAQWLEQSQQEAGFWEGDWYVGLHGEQRADPIELTDTQRTEQRIDRVLATGHHVEWLAKLPQSMRPDERCFRRAARWLSDCVIAEADEILNANYCPYTHAFNAVRILRPPETL